MEKVKIEKLYNQFLKRKNNLNEKEIQNREQTLDKKFHIRLTIGIFIIIISLVFVVYFLIKYITIKEMKIKISIIIIAILTVLYLLLYVLDFLFFKKIEQYNLKIKEKNSPKKFLEWIFKEKKNENIEFKKVKTPKTSIEVTCWVVKILISSGAIYYLFSDVLKIINKSLDNIKEEDVIGYIVLILSLPLFKDKVKNKLDNKKIIEKIDLEISNYVESYFEYENILKKIVDIKNEELVFKYIEKEKLSEIKKRLEKIDYIYKEKKLIFFIKFEYLEIFLDNLISHTYQKNEKQKQLKEKVVNKINNLDYIYINQEKIIRLVIEVK
jgi:hypothetical protein